MKTLILIAISMLIPLALFSFSGNGSGTEEAPYQITNIEQLQEMNDELDAHYILMNDIDASETRNWNVGDHDGDPETPDSAMGFEPVGTYKYNDSSSNFNGKLNGQGYLIKDIYINRQNTNFIGLFGYIGQNGTKIENCGLVNCKIIGKNYVGSIAGVNYGGSIAKSFVTGTIHGKNKVGGMVGCNSCPYKAESLLCEINSSFVDVSVLGNSNVGGFIGQNYSSVNNCYSIGCINGSTNVGGFCGLSIGKIVSCFSVGIVHGVKRIGGFCGSTCLCFGTDIINCCYSTCIVYGEIHVGGFCGENYEAKINNSYSTGEVNGNRNVGGFCGTNIDELSGEINFCYSTGVVNGNEYLGGFCGYCPYGRSEGFWDVISSRMNNSECGIGKATNDLKEKETFSDWDFNSIWLIKEGESYPKIRGINDFNKVLAYKNEKIRKNIANHHLVSGTPVICYFLKNSDTVNIEIYNCSGAKKMTLANEYQEAGSHEIRLGNNTLEPGMYFYVLRTRQRIESGKIIHIK